MESNDWEWKVAKIAPGVLYNKFIIVIPCYNAEETIKVAILTVLKQDFPDLGIIIRNDLSTDKTSEIVREIFGVTTPGSFYVKGEGRDVIYIENTKKMYGGGNTYDSVMCYCSDPYAIIGVVDGDDFLVAVNALSIIYEAYKTHPDKWLIWSQHISRMQLKKKYKGFSLPLPSDYIIYQSRRYWSVSHFRTCLAGLFHHIDPADLADPYDKNSYAKVCGDAAILYPIVELCGNEHSLFMDVSLYFYNDGVPTNDAEVYKSEIDFYKSFFENKTIYAPLPADHKFL
jgi:glycosyltransferase involved in cell wall biosynthesis